MPSLTFPCRVDSTSHQLGMPMRAQACLCGANSLVIEPRGTCLWCGYYQQATIDATWRLRALIVDLGPAGVIGMLKRRRRLS